MQYYIREVASSSIIFISILILFIIFLSGTVSSSELSSCVLNEIMVNPIESDTSHEWVELYNPTNKSINLSNWKLTDNYATDTILPANTNTSWIIPPKTFVLITDQDTELSIPSSENNSVVHFKVDDNSICNGLGNTDDYLKIIDENNTIVDFIEWGMNYSEIPGKPLQTPAEGNSFIRLDLTQSGNSIIDFAESTIPTPGKSNIFAKTGSIKIDKSPKYIPKTTTFEAYSTPFSIHVTFTNFTPAEEYQLKSFITENNSHSYPASQTWTGEKWQYSDRYTHTITTNKNGFWQGWIYLRFSKQYKSYQQHIQHNHTCSIHVKIKNNHTVEQTKTKASLLDIDNSTTHGTTGGLFIDTLKQKNQFLVLTNKTRQLVSIYKSEPNNINDFNPTIDGYCRLFGPIGQNYTLSTMNKTGVLHPVETNISIQQGSYHFDIKTEESSFDRNNRKQFPTTITINNTGDLKDTYLLRVADETANFHAQLHTKKITLRPQTEQQITVYIDPLSHRLAELHYGSVTIEIKSLTDPILQKTHTFTCHLHEPDLKIPKIKTYNNKGTETNVCYQGNIFRVKAFLKNAGDKTARDATVSYFLNTVTSENLLGMKTYETVEQYQKYPSLYLDTKQISPGDHTIIVVADYHDTIKELDEYNNENSIQITILNTTPTPIEQRLLITEFYYYAHPTIHNEFITIFNPTKITVNLDDWYLTTTVSKRCNDQKKILFPTNTKIQPNSSITLTQNSSAYYQECLTQPDYEYETNSNTSIPQLNTTHSIYFSNKGGAIALKNPFNHTIDALIYGNTTEQSTHWNGSFIPCINQGEILKRVKENTHFQDTNTANDWIQPKKFQIGQSTFLPPDFTINASVTPFISPDTSYSVISHFFKNANAEILLNAYEFTSEKITNLLIDALKRNVTITILIEGSPIGGISEKQTMLLNRLQAHGTTIHLLQGNRVDHTYKRYRFTHAKYAIIDQKTVIIHSGNFAPTGIPETPTFGNREWGIALTNETIAEWYASVFYEDANPKQPDTIVYSQNKIFDEHEYFLNEKEYYGWYQPITNQSSTMNKTITVQPVLSPDNSLSTITQFLSNATESIYIQQLYIYPNWTDSTNPLIPLLIQKANQGLDIRIILNYNPWYDSTNIHNNQTKTLLESYGIQVKYVYTNWSIFQNIHNKGAIIDNKSVLISSINWNENSFLNNREIGIIINHSNISQFYSTVFLSDWHLTKPTFNNETFSENNNQSIIELNTNTIYYSVYSMLYLYAK